MASVHCDLFLKHGKNTTDAYYIVQRAYIFIKGTYIIHFSDVIVKYVLFTFLIMEQNRWQRLSSKLYISIKINDVANHSSVIEEFTTSLEYN